MQTNDIALEPVESSQIHAVGVDEAAYYAGLFLLEAKPLASMVGLLRAHLVQDIEEPVADMFGDEDLGGAIAEKLAYNAQRADHKIENRRADGGKKY